MAAYLALRQTRGRGKTVQRERRNPLDLPDSLLLAEYRLSRELIKELCDLLRPRLERATNRSNALTVEEQVLLSLKILASGSFQNAAKDCVNVAQNTASTVLNSFLDALGENSAKFIYPPRDRHLVSEKFYGLSGFPGVIGAIDGTHIPIIAPKDNEHLFVCRKGFHSINVQAICDADMIFWNVVAKWPGSTHDSFILQQSEIFEGFENGNFGNSVLLGDSGYPLKKWLMVPIMNASSPAEDRYNKSHKETRVTVERAFGVLKQRWRILDHTGGYLCYTPLKVCKIIVCCMVLHNICRRKHIPLTASLPAEPEEAEQEAHTGSTDPTASNMRRNIVATIAGQ